MSSRDRAQQVERFVREGVAPADDVAGRPPVIPERMVGLGDEHRLEAARPVAVGLEDLELVQPLHVERERALRAVDLPLEGVAPAEGEPRRLDRPDRRRSRTRPPPRARRRPAGPAGRCGRDPATVEISPTRKRARSTTCVPRSPSAPRPRLVGLEAPGVEARVVAPVLEVAAAEVPDLAELAGLDQLARQPHRRHEAVVEAAEVLDARRRRRAARSRSSRPRRGRAASRRARACPPRRRRSSARRGASWGRRCRTGRSPGRRRCRASRSSSARSRTGRPRPRPPPRSAPPPRRAGAAAACRAAAISRNARECAFPMKA